MRVTGIDFTPTASRQRARGLDAHLTAVDGQLAGWYTSAVRRRLETVAWLARLAAERVRGPMTGTRLLAIARRGGHA